MNSKRTCLVPGQRLCFENGMNIEIDEVVGSGGTAITYYGRELIEDQESVRILVKELYPDDPAIHRDDNGMLRGKDFSAEHIYEALTEALYCEQELGNRIAQRGISGIYPMKEVMRERNTGNYYGLFYQCPPSITLRNLVEKASDHISLCGKLKLILSLCQLVRNLHETGKYCHNDISGGNVLIISNALTLLEADYVDWNTIERELQVGLIDFACAAELNRRGEAILPEEDEPLRFHTDGFSAPELYDGDNRYVTVKADVYSVTACLWYLLTGEVLETEDGYPVLGDREWKYLARCLRKHELCALSGDVRAAFGRNPNLVPEDLIEAVICLLERGLAEDWNRFRNMEIFEERLREIIDLAEGSSVSDVLLSERLKKAFEENRRTLRNRYTIRENMLPVISETSDNGYKKNSGTLLEAIMADKAVYAIGPGGVGKTTTMFRAAEELYQDGNHLIPVYIELNRLPMWKADSGLSPEAYWHGVDDYPMFIEQYLAGIYYGCQGKMTERNDLVAGALHGRIVRPNSNGTKYLVLLDGLNEMAFSSHEEKKAFASAINWYLKYANNIRIVLTSRYDEGLIDTEDIYRVNVSGLTDESVEKCLKEELICGHILKEEYEKLIGTDYNSNIWKCLKLPLFLAMYCRVEDKRKLNSAGEILQRYFHDKKVALDGSRLYSERVIGAEKFEDMQFTDELSMEVARRLIVDLLLPELGYTFMYKQIFFIEKKEAETFIAQCLSEKYSESIAKRYGYTFDVNVAIQKLQKVGAEKILSYICENIGLLVLGHGETYFFPHQYYRDYFAANKIIHIFCEVSEFLGKAMTDAYEEEHIQSLIESYAAQNIPESVLMLCGECLGVHRTVPTFENGKWECRERWDSLVDIMLEVCRKETEQSERVYLSREKCLYLEKNVFDMLRLCRRYRGRADLSGIDFSSITLKNCQVRNVIFSHSNEKGGIYANLTGTDLEREQFVGETVHYGEGDDDIIMHPEGTWSLVISTRTISQDSETVTKMHLEEREVLGDEVRPLGYWDTIEKVEYREDGQILGIVETKDNDMFAFKKLSLNTPKEATDRIVHFYDRKTGKMHSEKLDVFADASVFRWRQVFDCRWCGNTLVILQSTNIAGLIHTIVRLEGEQLVQEHKDILYLGEALKNGRCFIVDEERILIYYPNRGVIYNVYTGKTIWFDVETEWRYCAIDTCKNSVYTILIDGRVMRMNVDTGEMSLVQQSELFKKIEYLQICNEIFYFIARDSIYQSDRDFKNIRFIKELPPTQEPRRVLKILYSNRHVSVGGNYVAVSPNMVFKLSDGSVVKQQSIEEPFRQLPKKIWIHPQQEETRIRILDQECKVLHNLKIAKDRSLEYAGYSFIELEEGPVDAICVNSEQSQLITFCKSGIRYYDLNTGRKTAEKLDIDLYKYPIEEAAFAPDRYAIEEAVFAPDGKSLELRILEYREQQIALYTESRLMSLNLESGRKRVREIMTGLGSICRHEFMPEDILSGTDSGKRKTVYERNTDWSYRKNELLDRWVYEDPVFNDSYYLGRVLKNIKNRFANKKNAIEVIMFEHGDNICGMGKEGYLYWDAKREQMYEFPQERNSILSTRLVDEFNGQIFPFDDGFIVVKENQVHRYVENHEKKIMELFEWEYYPSWFTHGCPGTEHLPIMRTFKERYEFYEDEIRTDDEW